MNNTSKIADPGALSLEDDGLPNLCSIPPGVPFLPTLVDGILEGRLIEGYAPAADPLALANLTVWVPTRRAARALASEFVSRFEGGSALLPNICTLGDVEDDAFAIEAAAGSIDRSAEPVISAVHKHLILSRLVIGWSQSLNQEQRNLYQDNHIIMPSSVADAVWFAAELARLMDQIATEECDWTQLGDLVPEEHANWWQLTLEFLKIATHQWPAILDELQLLDTAAQRVRQLRRQAHIYEQYGSPGPVIAAGSTGSIPATAELLKSIAQMPNGAVVLPGLDRDLDNETWEKVDLPDNQISDGGTAPGHPQYGLKKLLAHLGSSRQTQDIQHLGDATESGTLRLRELLISEALRPPHSTGQWQNLFEKLEHPQVAKAVEGIALIEAEGERQEALAIAIALRETLEQPGKTAALVTPDRNLARRVAAEMLRFGIEIDDSGGQPLRNSAEGNFLRLVLQVAFGPASSLTLISLLKHPLCLLGETPARARNAARVFELTMLRGAVHAPQIGQLLELAKQMHRSVEEKTRRTHRVVRRLSAQDWQDVFWLCEAVDGIFGPVRQLESTHQTADQFTRHSISLIEACALDHLGFLGGLYGSENGRAISSLLAQLLDHGALLEAMPAQWPDIFDALMGQQVTRSTPRAHSRIAILGPLEARLQTYDRVILGGLNEGSWPASTRNDAFLSRPMKAALGLPPPERRTGLAAHDFQVLLGIEDVLLTRSNKADNAPTIASRWLQRLAIVTGESPTADMKKRGSTYLDWARQIDAAQGASEPCQQPRPTPPLDVRPNGLSITEIETWIMDPYAIYARRILQLDPLDPLQRQPDARERGELYHAIVEDFVTDLPDPNASDGLDRLIDIARRHFDAAALPDDIRVQWWPRFCTIAGNLLTWQRQHIADVEKIFVELSGSCDVGLDGFTLRGRVDRIDRLADGRLAIFDYKTGLHPTLKSVLEFNSPQLPLEAAMALRGAFGADLKRETAQLGYIRLRASNALSVDILGPETSKTPAAHELSEMAWERLRHLIAAYRDPTKDYRSKARPAPDRSWQEGYDHLARVREWAVTDDEESES